jgi:hypothetical protein
MEKEEAVELVIKAGGNAPGPLRVAFELLTDPLVGRIALELAIENDITGGELWLLYKDVHGGDLGATREALCLKQALGQLQKLRYSKHYQTDEVSE